MALKVVLHLAGEEAIMADLAALPGVSDQFITVRNPSKRDGKALSYLTHGATSFLFPMQRITFIEVMGGEEDERSDTNMVAFFREENLPRRR